MPDDELPLDDLEPPTKRCPRCGERKPLDGFPRNRSTRDGRGAYCKPCHNTQGRENKIKNHGGTRHYHLMARYGISAADAQRMFEEQDGLCAICRERPADHVDHDHLTGSVRRLLCFNCNGGLGNFRDDPRLLRLAADYLESFEQQSA